MKANQLFRLFVLVVITFSGVMTFTACKKNIGPDNPETPQLLDGTRQIVINARQFTNDIIEGYTLKITGPQTLTVQPAGQSYTLTGIKNGVYTISLSKNGYVGMTKVVQADLPTDNTVSWKYSVDLYLVKKNAPVSINNATGGVITVPATGLGPNGTNGKPTQVVIPAGALAGTGTTNISVTLIPVDPSAIFAQTVSGATGSVSFYCEPEGLVFNAPVTFSIPMDIPAAIAASVPYHFASKSGDPGNGNMVFSGDQVLMNVDPNGSAATVQVTKAGYWQVVGDYTITETASPSTYIQAGSSQFGSALNGVYTATGSFGPMFNALLDLPNGEVSISESFSYPAVEFYQVVANARHTNKLYTIKLNSNNNTIEQFTVPSAPVEFIFLIMSHNQGGN